MTRLTILCTALVALAGTTSAQTPKAQPAAGSAMEKVDGIGGFFFRSKAPKVLAKWYADHLGVTLTPTEAGQEPWQQSAGPAAFEPFPENTKYFGRAENMWMLNFRVLDLDAMVAQLRAADITVAVDPKQYPNGRFAHLNDPDGNPIELWQPQRKSP
jgi:glyoxylase I family protein